MHGHGAPVSIGHDGRMLYMHLVARRVEDEVLQLDAMVYSRPSGRERHLYPNHIAHRLAL